MWQLRHPVLLAFIRLAAFLVPSRRAGDAQRHSLAAGLSSAWRGIPDGRFVIDCEPGVGDRTKFGGKPNSPASLQPLSIPHGAEVEHAEAPRGPCPCATRYDAVQVPLLRLLAGDAA